MKRRILIGLAAVAVAAGVGWLAYSLLSATSVPVAEAQQRQIVETLVATGNVDPEGQTTLSAEVAATVEAVEFEAGDTVEAQTPLIFFDDGEAQLAVDQAQASVAQARAQLRSVVDQGAPTSMQDLEQAQIGLDAAEQEYARAQQLFEAGVISRAEVDEGRREVDRARSRVAQAQTVYEQSSDQGSTYDEAAAMVARAESELQLAQRRLQNFTIYAPSAATILSREVEAGASVQPGAVLARISPDGPVDIRITPDERELAHLEAGQPAIAVTDAFPDRRLKATVHRIDPTVDAGRGTIATYLRIDDPPKFLRADMTATVDIELERRDEGLVVPRVAVRDLATASAQVLVIDDGRARAVAVETGLEDERFVEITEGLRAGDVVIATTEVSPGDRVRRGPDYAPPDDGDDAIDDSPGDGPALPDPDFAQHREGAP